MRYWIFINNKAEGPFSNEELRRMESFTPDTLICPDGARGGEEWQPAHARPELQELLRNMPKRYWVLADDQKTKGPFDIDQLRKIQGLSPTTRVCPFGARSADDWKPAGEVQDLRPLFEQPKPPARTQPPPGPTAAPPAPPPKKTNIIEPEKKRHAGRPFALVLSVFLIVALGYAFRNYWNKLQRRIPAPPQTAAAIPSAPALSPGQKRLKEALIFVKAYPLQGTVFKKMPTNLHQIGDNDDTHWKPIKKLVDLFRYAPFSIAAKSASALAQAQGISAEEAARLVRAKIEEWKGLDETYQVVWSANPEGESRFRVEAKVTDRLTSGLQEAFAGISASTQPHNSAETHAFMADLAAKTLEPITPAAEQDLKPEPTQEPAQPKAAPPPPSVKPKKTKSPAARKRTQHPLKPPQEPRPDDRERPPLEPEKPSPEPERTSLLDTDLDAVGTSPSEQPQKPSSEKSPAKVQPPSKREISFPARENSPKSAAEMSVEELEKYLQRK